MNPANAKILPPSAAGLAELAAELLVRPSAVEQAARQPAPSAAVSFFAAAFSASATVLIVVVHGIVSGPDFLERFPLWAIASAGVASILCNLILLTLLAGGLHALGILLGGRKPFGRALQVAAMLSFFGPLQVLCNWFTLAWILPTLAAAWLAAACLNGFYDVGVQKARAACAALALLVLSAQALGHRALDRVRVPQGLGSMTEALPMDTTVPIVGDDRATPPASVPGTSSLDLLRGGGIELASEGPSAAPQNAPAIAAAKGLQANAAGMLDSIAPLLDNPALTRNMNAGQKADVRELQDMVRDIKAQMASGKSLSNAEFGRRMARYQELVLRIMAAGIPPSGLVQPGRPAPSR